MALYLSASAVAGPFAGVAVSLAGVACLAWRARCEARGRLSGLWPDEEGWVEWCDRIGRSGTWRVVVAVRVGGLWVSLSAQPLSTKPNAQIMQTKVQGGTRAAERVTLSWLRSIPGFGTRPRAWLLPADALDPEAFRALAVRVPHIPRSRP